MVRVRRAAAAALVLIVALGSATLGASSGLRATVAAIDPQLLAAVPWPTSGAILLAEVVTGGGSASDEYVEITNASAATVDLGGARARLRDLDRLDGHAQGDLGDRPAARARPAPPRRQRRRDVRGRSATRRTPAASRRPVAPWRSGRSAARRSTRSAGATPRTHSSRVRRRRRHRPDRASSAGPAGRPGTSSTRTTTAPTGWSWDRPSRRTCRRRRSPAPARRRAPARVRPRPPTRPRRRRPRPP